MQSAAIVTHYENKDSLEALKEYLFSKEYNALQIYHPLSNYKVRPTLLMQDGVTRKIKRHNLGILNWVVDFVMTVRVLRHRGLKLYIGVSNIDTLPAIFLRKIMRKKVSKIIYYPRDFSGERFNIWILNKVYYMVEAIAVKHSDFTISNTRRAESQRIKLGLLKKKSIHLPNGVMLRKPRFNPKKINKRHFIFVGDVTAAHGLYEFIECLYESIDKLVIIGFGDDWDRTIKLCKKLRINIKTHFQKDHKFVLDYMESFDGIGLAPYNLTSVWTYYCSPLKVVEYVSMGLPVIMSGVPEIATEIKGKKLGVTYSELDSVKIVSDLNKLNFTNFQKKAEIFYNKYNYDELLKRLPL